MPTGKKKSPSYYASLLAAKPELLKGSTKVLRKDGRLVDVQIDFDKIVNRDRSTHKTKKII